MESVRKSFQKHRPDVIINTAAFVRVDDCETRQDEAHLVNAIGARNIAVCAEEIKAIGGEVLAVPADLTNEAEVNALVQKTLEQYGRVDILVNLAGGLTKFNSITETSLEDWTSELNNNLLSAFLGEEIGAEELWGLGEDF
jgi:NAD(P)-dependent dehydrogenase (short-subunit alcohol dehydrogenase family)